MLRSRTKLTTNRPAGKWSGTLFGVIWTALSSIFVVVGLFVFWNRVKANTWDEVPCSIETFRIYSEPDDDDPFKVELAFNYQVDGRSYTGTKLSPGFDGADAYEILSKMEQRLFEKDEVFTCRVNPLNPEDAVLFTSDGSNWFGLIFVAFGGGFVLIGIGIITSSVRGGDAKKSRTAAAKSNQMGGLLALGFFGVFAAVGVGLLVFLVAPTAIRYVETQRWVETQGEVIWSRLRSYSSSDGTTYRADVFYRYTYAGQEYRSNRYGYMGTSSSSGRGSKQKIVDSHPENQPIVCYVNPDDPTEAIMNRSLGWWALFGLFPFPFAAVGLGGLYFSFFRKKGSRTEARGARQGHSFSAMQSSVHAGRNQAAEGFKRLSSMKRRLLWVLGAFFFAAFWNGIVSVFVVSLWQDWSSGSPSWGMVLFLTPFVLIGLGLIVHLFYRIAAVFSPLYQLEMNHETVAPGEALIFKWARSGGYGRPRSLKLWLIGREEATYQRGTSTVTAREIFHETALHETSGRLEMSGGRCEIVIPEDAVPTFRSAHNRLEWHALFVLDVPGMPDVREECPIEVIPKQFPKEVTE